MDERRGRETTKERTKDGVNGMSEGVMVVSEGE
jgi:hypothetical protein